MKRPGAPLRRALGLILVTTSLLPVYRLLDDPATGPAGRATVELADATRSLALWSLALVLVLSVALARLLAAFDPAAALRRIGDRLEDRPAASALGVPAALALALGLVVSLGLFRGYPTALDEMAHLVQARFMAVGRLAGAGVAPPGAWIIQNTLITDAGWASQYPPLHTAVLSLGMRAGALWITGPLLTALTVLFTGLVARRLLKGTVGLATAGALTVAVSPFVLFLGAGYLSHVSAAALGAGGLWLGLEARDGKAYWALGAGLAAGALIATRPWTGLVLSGLFTVGVWLPAALRGRGLLWLLMRVSAALFGSLPGGLWLAWYNTRMFGDPLRFGYGVLQGPDHGLGLHADPWGNAYGVIQATGYTAADLLQLGVHLLETPAPALLVVGLYLVLAPKLRAGEGVLLGWALLPVGANTLYWHHGHHLGPRMLYESAPAWILLSCVAAAGLIRLSPSGWPRRSVSWAVLLSVAWALVLGVPGRVQSYRWSTDTLSRIRVPGGAPGGLVFVHGAWSGRLSARLAGLGMRLDSVETAIRRNDSCLVQAFVDTWERSGNRARAQSETALDFRPLPGNAPGLGIVEVAPGSLVRVDAGRPPTPECTAEARADRFGVVELAPLVWQGDLPGIESGAPMFVRDLGPVANERMRRRAPDRPAFLLAPTRVGGAPLLVPYDEGMGSLWGADP